MVLRGLRVGRTKAALAYIAAIDRREVDGLPVFGDYDPQTDKRSMAQETAEEVEDGGVYQRFERKKYAAWKEMIALSNEINFHLFKAWELLQRQKEMERTAEKESTI